MNLARLLQIAALGFWLCACLYSLDPISSARAQNVIIEDEEAARANPNKLVDAAEKLIVQGLFEQAEFLLGRAEAFGANLNAIRFARAFMAQSKGQLQQAAKLYRAILLEEPDALRVRLELGRVYYLLNDDTKAILQFRYALAGDLPAGCTR